MFYRLGTSVGQRGKIRRSDVRFLMGTQNFFFVLSSSQDEKTSFSISLSTSPLTIFFVLLFTKYSARIIYFIFFPISTIYLKMNERGKEENDFKKSQRQVRSCSSLGNHIRLNTRNTSYQPSSRSKL